RSDLPAARTEATAVAQTLGPAAPITLLRGRDVTRAAFASALADASLLHYAGHGDYAGVEGWRSALLLAGDDELSVTDVFALPRVPSRVVLSGCETAQSSGAAGPISLGIAQAFLAAGSETAIAAMRPVDDRDTMLLMEDLYTELAAKRSGDLADALRAAQMQATTRLPLTTWSAFRALAR